MAVNRQASASTRRAGVRPRRLLGGGTTGNERLTGATGGVLIVLLAVIGVTIVALGPLLWVHLFVGMLLIGPGRAEARQHRLPLRPLLHRPTRATAARGRPRCALRLIAPIVVLTHRRRVRQRRRAAVRRSELARHAAADPQGQLLRLDRVHGACTCSLICRPCSRSLRADYVARRRERRADGPVHDADGRAGRVMSLAGALVLGLVLAILVIPEFGPWLCSHTTTEHVMRQHATHARDSSLRKLSVHQPLADRRQRDPHRGAHRRGRARLPEQVHQADAQPRRRGSHARHSTLTQQQEPGNDGHSLDPAGASAQATPQEPAGEEPAPESAPAEESVPAEERHHDEEAAPEPAPESTRPGSAASEEAVGAGRLGRIVTQIEPHTRQTELAGEQLAGARQHRRAARDRRTSQLAPSARESCSASSLRSTRPAAAFAPTPSCRA